MLTRPARPSRGFMLVFVMAAVALLGLLTMAAFHLVLDHRHRRCCINPVARARHDDVYAQRSGQMAL